MLRFASLAALLLLLPLPGKELERPEVVNINGMVVNNVRLHRTCVIDSMFGMKRLKKCDIPVPLYYAEYIGDRVIFVDKHEELGSREFDEIWYLVDIERGWVPATWEPPCYLRLDWDGWRKNRAYMDSVDALRAPIEPRVD
jgi:hypothetical protein